MPYEDHSRQTPAEEATSRLENGLKSCRKLVDDYRAVISERPKPSAGAIGDHS